MKNKSDSNSHNTRSDKNNNTQVTPAPNSTLTISVAPISTVPMANTHGAADSIITATNHKTAPKITDEPMVSVINMLNLKK